MAEIIVPSCSLMSVIYGNVPMTEMHGHVLIWKFLYDSMAVSLWEYGSDTYDDYITVMSMTLI